MKHLSILLLLSCTAATEITIKQDAYLMQKQSKAIDTLYHYTGVRLSSVPAFYHEIKEFARVYTVNGKQCIAFNPNHTWTPEEMEFILLHELGHVNGLSHSTGIMSNYYPGFGSLYKKHKEQLLMRFVEKL